MKNYLVSALAIAALSACGGSGTSNSYDFDGLQTTQSFTLYSGGANLVGSGSGYRYQVGVNTAGDALVAEADLLRPSSLPAPDPTGTATMTGPYQLRIYQDAVMVGDDLRGTGIDRDGTITLTADFDAQTLKGNVDGLAIDGKFSETGNLSGAVSYDTMTGKLGGDVSPDAALGVFQGGNSTGVFAGGFAVN